MKITYDKDADAMYIKLSNEKFNKTKIINQNTILDLEASQRKNPRSLQRAVELRG